MRMGGSSEGVSGDSAAGKASLRTPPACGLADAAAPEPAGLAAPLPLLAGAAVPPHAASAAPPMVTRVAFKKARRPSSVMSLLLLVTSAPPVHPAPARPEPRAGPAGGLRQGLPSGLSGRRPGGLWRRRL